MEEGEGISQRHKCTTGRHRQQCAGGRGRGAEVRGGAQRGEMGTSVMASTTTKKKLILKSFSQDTRHRYCIE